MPYGDPLKNFNFEKGEFENDDGMLETLEALEEADIADAEWMAERAEEESEEEFVPKKVEPTPNQVKFAKSIADRLEIDLPEEETYQAYSEFIGKNKDKFYNLPTEKQIDFADSISKELDIPLPDKYTLESYKKFISDNVDRFYENRKK